ncbi:cold shock domain-containing protein [Rhodococcus opacus]|nr:cold shock domain-containing protein [Rhodococcus opacus]
MPCHRTVRTWSDEEGWGVIDSDATPGGAWTHFSNVVGPGLRSLTPGQQVTFRARDGRRRNAGRLPPPNTGRPEGHADRRLSLDTPIRMSA